MYKNITILDFELSQLNHVPIQNQNDRILSLLTIRSGLRFDNKSSYLIAFVASLDEKFNDFNPKELKHKYVGKNIPKAICWLVKY